MTTESDEPSSLPMLPQNALSSQEEIILKLLQDVKSKSPRMPAQSEVFEQNLQLLLNDHQKNDPKV